MLNAKIDHCQTLQEFYKEIRSQQEAAHGADYCAHHDAIAKLMKKCSSYKELGTQQGASAAAACLSNPNKVSLVDISFKNFNPSKHLFEEYCDSKGIELELREMDSTDRKTAGECDLLLIDSRHYPDHLTKELELHAKHVNKYIIFHDTSRLFGRPDERLWRVVEEFANKISNTWVIKERNTSNVGYTIIENL